MRAFASANDASASGKAGNRRRPVVRGVATEIGCLTDLASQREHVREQPRLQECLLVVLLLRDVCGCLVDHDRQPFSNCVITGTQAWNIESAICLFLLHCPETDRSRLGVPVPRGQGRAVSLICINDRLTLQWLDCCTDRRQRKSAGMNYVFQFGDVWAARGRFALGVLAHHPAFRQRDGARAAGRGVLRARQDHGAEAGTLAGRRLCRGHPQHAVPGADLPHLLRPAACRRHAQLERGGAAGDGGECRRLRHRNRARRHREHQPRPDRGRHGARPAPVAGVPLCRACSPRSSTVYPGAEQPVHPADAQLERGLDDFRAGTDGDRATTCSRAPSAASRSTSWSPGSTWCWRCCSPPRSAASIAWCSPARDCAEHACAQFGPDEALFIIAAVRWTLLLSLSGLHRRRHWRLVVALARTAPPAWLRALPLGYIQVFQGTPLLMQLFLVFFGCTCSAPASIRWPRRRSR